MSFAKTGMDAVVGVGVVGGTCVASGVGDGREENSAFILVMNVLFMSIRLRPRPFREEVLSIQPSNIFCVSAKFSDNPRLNPSDSLLMRSHKRPLFLILVNSVVILYNLCIYL